MLLNYVLLWVSHFPIREIFEIWYYYSQMKTFQVHAWQPLSSCFCLVAQSCQTLCDPMDCSPSGSSVREISQASTGEGCHFLLQGVFPTQGLNSSLLQVSSTGRGSLHCWATRETCWAVSCIQRMFSMSSIHTFKI